MRPIAEVAEELGVPAELVLPYGRDKAKVELRARERARRSEEPARLVLVSAITPTPAGEGKTTTTIGVGDALRRLGQSVCIALREPSLGPCFGIKGGGTGGGQSQVVPSDDINLHFTGDFHAITAAHNLLAASIDNHVHFGTKVGLEPRSVLWRRVLDVNDRSLRDVVIGLGGTPHGVPRETGFDITAASEVMAMVCLSDDAEDLRGRLDRALVGFRADGSAVVGRDVGATGAMLALLRDVLHPNLVQTREGTPAFVHGGPFANIAHGCNSIIATKMALHHADWVVTEAGFGFDLGAEKFFDIKCRAAGLETAAVVLVATVRALKMHGGRALDELDRADPDAVAAGLPNLEKHIENIAHFGQHPVVALNRFHKDADEEIAVVEQFCREREIPFALGDHYTLGSEGAVEIARAVREVAQRKESRITPLYSLEDTVPEKISAVARSMYGASDVAYTKTAERDLQLVERLGYTGLPVCIAKTQNSLSDDPKLRGRPRDFQVTVRGIQINAGAGFLVVLTGEVLRMPGLPKVPQLAHIDLQGGEIVGLK
jgi:formate--tetrahydrofolate ligase